VQPVPSVNSLRMSRQAYCASTLAIVALAAHGEAVPATAPTVRPSEAVAPAETVTPGVTEEQGASRWWSFDQKALLGGLGVDDERGIAGLGLWDIILDLRATGNMQNTTSPNFTDQKFYSYLTDEGLTVRNSGWYLLDPRLVSGSASVRFGLQQARQDAGDVGIKQDADVTDYYLSVALLQEKPYNAMLQASHVEFVTSHSGGGTTASSNSLRGASLYWREASILRDKEIAPYFSATLQGGQEDLQETTTNAGQQFRRDEQRERVEVNAHNGFRTGDLTVNLEQVDLTNRIYTAGSYSSRSADMNHSLDFGHNLTRHSDLHVNYNQRTGDFATETLDVDQHLFFDHTAFLSSSAFYLFQSIDSEIGSSTSQRINLSSYYMPFLNVATNANLSGGRVEYDTGTVASYGGGAGATYNHWLPWGGALAASATGGLNYTDSQLSSALVPVVDSPYQAPPELGAGAGFVLNETDVVTSTIVVVDVRGGARLSTVIGIDYEVEVEGNRTKIVPLATSPVIQAGDPLEVSYTHLMDPSLESRITSQSYFLSGDWQWIVVSLTHDITKQEPLSGQQQTLLSDQNRTALRVDLRHDWGDWRAMGNARAARFRDERLSYDEVRINENITWRPSYDWQLTLDASQTQSEFLNSGRTSRHLDGRLGGTWHSRRGWWADGYLTWRKEQDSEMADERITEGFLRVRRNWPQLSFSCSVGVGQRNRDTVTTMYQNLQINITRTF
jgi:hypothetical protein